MENLNMEIVRELYATLNMDFTEDTATRDYNNDYLSINKGRDGVEYYWYFDGAHKGAIPVAGGDVITNEAQIEALFC